MKKLVSSLVATVALTTSIANAADYYATVNGDKITKQDVYLALNDPRADVNKLPKKLPEPFMNQLIDNKLLIQNAVKDSSITNSKEYKNALKKIKENLAYELWNKKQFDKIKVTEKQKKDFYNKNKKLLDVPAILEARHILVKTETEAKEIINQINKASKKKTKFVELAKTKSIGPTGKKGGYLGKFPEYQMVPEFSNAAKKLKKKSYTKTPVKSQFGYHVIYLEDMKPGKSLSFKQVKGKITQILTTNEYAKNVKPVVDKLRKNAKIVIK